MDIAIGSDPAGFHLKGYIVDFLHERGHKVLDVGCISEEPAHYPIFAEKCTEHIVAKKCERAILICGTGQGMAMSANKVPSIRAAICHDEFAAVMSREHNDANVLCMGAWVMTPDRACRIVEIWLFAKFSGGEVHSKRIEMMDRMGRTE